MTLNGENAYAITGNQGRPPIKPFRSPRRVLKCGRTTGGERSELEGDDT